MNKFKTILSALLLALAFNIGAMDENKPNDLLEAIEHGNTEQVKQLIKKGADVNTTYAHGYTPFHLAAANSSTDTEMVKILIEAGAKINGQISRGRFRGLTPLHIAVHYGHIKNVKILIKSGADINAKSTCRGFCRGFCGATPLFIAASKSCHRKISLILLHNGAMISENTQKALNKLNITPLQIAIAQSDIQKTLSLLKNQPITEYLLEIPAICGDVYMMRFLLQFNPSEEAIKHAFLKIENKTDDKSMLIKTMLILWHDIQQATNETEKAQLLTRFNKIMLHAAEKYNLTHLFFLDKEPGKLKEYLVNHIAYTVEKKEKQKREKKLQKELDDKMEQLKKAMATEENNQLQNQPANKPWAQRCACTIL